VIALPATSRIAPVVAHTYPLEEIAASRRAGAIREVREHMASGDFSGFGAEAQAFFADLGQNNNKEWFHEHRDRYDTEILEPATTFVVELGERLRESFPSLRFGTQRNGSGSIMRINRDIRFSPDKRPYKENLGVIFWLGEGKKVEQPCFYFHVDATRSFFYGGQHQFPRPVLERYRQAVNEDKRGSQLERILADLEADGLPLMEEPAYKRVPRGYDREHPREHLLRLAGIGVGTDVPADMLVQGDLTDYCVERAGRMKPLLNWLTEMNGMGRADG
jgi:uncharacterized protein (TIGR02453 family)